MKNEEIEAMTKIERIDEWRQMRSGDASPIVYMHCEPTGYQKTFTGKRPWDRREGNYLECRAAILAQMEV